jgi:PhnB protein
MAKNVPYAPPTLGAITPHLIVRGAAKAIAFYKEVFGAKELSRNPGPDGQRLMHAHIEIAGSHLFLADEFPEMGPCRSPAALGASSVTLTFYCPNVDEVFKRAVAAGATVKMPPMDMFWGDRYCQVTDPFGHDWALATHIEDVPPDELQRRGQAAFAGMGKKPG